MPKWQSESSRESLISNRFRLRCKIIHPQKTTQKQSARRFHPFADTMKACHALHADDKPFFVTFSAFLLSLRSSNLVHESGSKKRKNCFFLYVFFRKNPIFRVT